MSFIKYLTEESIEFTSVLEKIVNDVNQMVKQKDLDGAKKVAIDTLNASKVNPESKNKMVDEIQKITNVSRLQQYIYNAILKYKDLGVIPVGAR